MDDNTDHHHHGAAVVQQNDGMTAPSQLLVNGMVPIQLLLQYFHQVITTLQTIEYDINNTSSSSLLLSDTIRNHLIQTQMDCLNNIVNEYNKSNRNDSNDKTKLLTIEQIQETLQHLPSTIESYTTTTTSSGGHNETINHNKENHDDNNDKTTIIDQYNNLHQIMNEMNHKARLAYTRLMIQSQQYNKQNERRNNNMKIDPMNRADILEFCTLCILSIQLPNVYQHLRYGTPLFSNTNNNNKVEDDNDKDQRNETKHSFQLPAERLHHTQGMILQALGYDPDYGMNEMKRIFDNNNNNNNEFINDIEIMNIFQEMLDSIQQTLQQITYESSQDICRHYNDGMTRIVSIEYTEKVINPKSGKEIFIPCNDNSNNTNNNYIDFPPKKQSMDNNEDVVNDDHNCSFSDDGMIDDTISKDHHDTNNNTNTSHQVDILQQEILNELMTMNNDDRNETLLYANQVSNDIILHIQTLSLTSERITYMKSLDSKTQRLMAMNKIWNVNMLLKSTT